MAGTGGEAQHGALAALPLEEPGEIDAGARAEAGRRLDERLDENSYIVPGLGDAGDRLYGTV